MQHSSSQLTVDGVDRSSTPNSSRFRLVVDVHLLLHQRGRVLLGKRRNTGFADGAYHPPAGHLEADESILDALIREAKEEVGITLQERSVRLAHVMHNASGDGRVALFFECSNWEGHVTNMEPDKCEELRWFAVDALPSEMVGYARYALSCYRKAVLLSTYGWPP